MWLGMDMFGFLILGICLTFWICKFMSFTKLGIFSLSSQICSHCFTLFFLNSSDMNVRPVIAPWVPEALFVSFCIIFSVVLDRIISFNLFSSLPTLYSYHHSTIEPIQWVFVIAFFILTFPFDASSYRNYLLRFSILTFFVRVFAVFIIAVYGVCQITQINI